jgi:hypothetical protein
MTREIERERLLQRAEARKVLLVPGFLELLQGLVRLLHVALVMTAMMKLHDLARNVRLQRTEVVLQIR